MIAFITLTNTGYIQYTLNCLKSLEKINFDGKLISYCIGNEGYSLLKEKGYETILFDNEINSNFNTFKNNNWNKIMSKKIDIIYQNLLKNDYVLYTDGDIVYENLNFINYLKENINDNDILIQNDTLNNNDNSNLCCGFIFIKSNEKTMTLFNPENIQNKENKEWDDQTYINSIKNSLTYKLLPLELFPNGRYYYNNFGKINPYLIHFNWVVGHEKKQKMTQYRKWYSIQIKYGSSTNNIDVTDICYTKLRKNNTIIIPSGDHERASYFGDPHFGVLKSIFLIDENNNINEFKHDLLIEINILNNKITL